MGSGQIHCYVSALAIASSDLAAGLDDACSRGQISVEDSKQEESTPSLVCQASLGEEHLPETRCLVCSKVDKFSELRSIVVHSCS